MGFDLPKFQKVFLKRLHINVLIFFGHEVKEEKEFSLIDEMDVDCEAKERRRFKRLK